MPQDARYAGNRHGFAAGVGAGAAMLLGMVLLRLASGVISLPEIVADGFLLLLPGATFSVILDTLGRAAKLLMYGGVGVGILLVGGLLGRWYAARPFAARLLRLPVGVWLLLSVGLYPLFGAGFFGSRLRAGPVWHAGTLLLLLALFAVVLWRFEALLRARLQPASSAPPASASRRMLLGTVLGASVAVVGGGVAFRAALDSPDEPAPPTSQGAANPPPFDVPGLTPEIISASNFYTVSKNLVDPSVNASDWKLRVDGLVDRPLELTYDQLRALPASDGAYTLMCISNEVGGDLWGNARWRGVKLASLLEQAGVQPGVRDAVFSAADNYQDSVPVERALHPDTLLAWEMNGEPLTKAHGAPARLLIPGIYGMKNVKWLTGISLVPEDFKGYWQIRGWDDQAPYHTASRIDTPYGRATVQAGALDIAGVAFAGDRGIQAVEVSLDAGTSWQPAQVKEPLSPYAWSLWKARVTVSPSTRQLQVRATDGTGQVQTARETSPFPSGSTGYHTVRIQVA